MGRAATIDTVAKREIERLERAIVKVDANLALRDPVRMDELLDQRLEFAAALAALRERAGA